MVSRVLLAMVSLGSLLCAAPASAQDIWGTSPSTRSGAASGPSTSSGAAAQPAVAPPAAVAEAQVPDASGSYAERVLAGLRQIVVRDFESAIVTLRGAAQLEPASAVAFCHLGDAQLGKANWAEARASYETCARFAALAKDARYQTLAAVGSARVAELSQASLAERRDAYVRLDASTSDSAAKIMAAARIAVFDGLSAMDADYAIVRKRIAERAAQNPPKK